MYDDDDDENETEIGSDEWYEDCYDECVSGDDTEYWDREIERAGDKRKP